MTDTIQSLVRSLYSAIDNQPDIGRSAPLDYL